VQILIQRDSGDTTAKYFFYVNRINISSQDERKTSLIYEFISFSGIKLADKESENI
jgi:hypothetical protein